MKPSIQKTLPAGIERHFPQGGETSILLIAPPHKRSARLHSLSYLAGTLNRSDLLSRIAAGSNLGVTAPQQPFFVRVLDLELAPKSFDLKTFLKRFSPSVIGVTVNSLTVNFAIGLARLAKEAAPNAVRIMGGYHPSAFPVETLLSSTFQIAAIGYGEETLGELAMCVNHYGREELQRHLPAIAGIAFKDQQGKIVVNPRREYKIELDAFPFPHTTAPLYVFDAYDTEERQGGILGAVSAARGCPYRCKYCAGEVVHQNRVRFRSAKSVLTEMEELHQQGARMIMFEDETFALHREVREILAGLRRLRELHPDLHWAVETRGDKLSPQLLTEMVGAGLKQMAFGVETPDETLARDVKNDPTLSMDHVTGIVEQAESAGVSIAFNLLVGFPGQTWQSLLRSANYLLRHAPDRAGVGMLKLYGGSAYRRQAARRDGIRIIKEHPWLPEFETADLTREEIIKALTLFELLIYYIRWQKKCDPEFQAMVKDLWTAAVADAIRIYTIYDLFIRSKGGREERPALLRQAYKRADRVFQKLMDFRGREDATFLGLFGSTDETRFAGFEFLQIYREALNLNADIKTNYLDNFLGAIRLENAFSLIRLPFPLIRIFIFSLNTLWHAYCQNHHETVKTVKLENADAVAQLIEAKLAGKTSRDLNEAAQAFDDSQISHDGAEFEFFGIPFRYDAQNKTLVIRAVPSPL